MYTSIRNSRVDWVADSLTTPLTDSSGGFAVRFNTTHKHTVNTYYSYTQTQSTHNTHTHKHSQHKLLIHILILIVSVTHERS